MQQDDEADVVARLRAAKPGSSHRHAPLTPRALAELEQLGAVLAAERPPSEATRPRRARRTLALMSIAATVVLAVAVVLVWANLQPDRAVAITPPPLIVAATHGTAKGLLSEASSDLVGGRPGGAAAAPRSGVIRTHQWALESTVSASGRITSSASAPELRTLTFGADGSVDLVVRAAQPFRNEATAKLPKPGTVIEHEHDAASEYDDPYPTAPPTRARLVGAYLAHASGLSDPTAGDDLRTIADLISNRLLSAAQEAALLRFLATEPGITAAGTTTDRLGRPGEVFVAADRKPGEFKDLLIVSPTTGEILAAETIYIGTDRTDIPSPAPTDYRAWQR